MAIFKKYNKSTSLSNAFLQNKNISLQAKGLLGFMLSLPDNWKFTIEGIAECTGEKPRKIVAILHELTKNGYHIKKHCYENGRIKEWIYYTFAEPRQDIIDDTFTSEAFEEEQKQHCTFQQCCSVGAVNNNINIIRNNIPDFNINIKNPEKNISNTIDKIKEKKLTKKQLKEKELLENETKIKEYLEQFNKNYNEEIQQLINTYIDLRKQKGLTYPQLVIILSDFKKECGSDIDYSINCLRKAIAGGWSQIVFTNNFSGKLKTSYSSFDNTASHFTGNSKITDEQFNNMTFDEKFNYISNTALADMTEIQRQFFDNYCIAKDENGNDLEF